MQVFSRVVDGTICSYMWPFNSISLLCRDVLENVPACHYPTTRSIISLFRRNVKRLHINVKIISCMNLNFLLLCMQIGRLEGGCFAFAIKLWKLRSKILFTSAFSVAVFTWECLINCLYNSHRMPPSIHRAITYRVIVCGFIENWRMLDDTCWAA